jgi:hypothetical protein
MKHSLTMKRGSYEGWVKNNVTLHFHRTIEGDYEWYLRSDGVRVASGGTKSYIGAQLTAYHYSKTWVKEL